MSTASSYIDGKPVIFTAYSRDGQAMMSTPDESGIYDMETLRDMSRLGYTFIRYGKAWTPDGDIVKTENTIPARKRAKTENIELKQITLF